MGLGCRGRPYQRTKNGWQRVELNPRQSHWVAGRGSICKHQLVLFYFLNAAVSSLYKSHPQQFFYFLLRRCWHLEITADKKLQTITWSCFGKCMAGSGRAAVLGADSGSCGRVRGGVCQQSPPDPLCLNWKQVTIGGIQRKTLLCPDDREKQLGVLQEFLETRKDRGGKGSPMAVHLMS